MQNKLVSAGRSGTRRRLALTAIALLAVTAVAGANAPATAPMQSAVDAASTARPVTRLATLDMPVADGRITSPYGWRVHPILKRRRFHKGVDFGAPEGTPVHAAEDGVIESIGRNGHYGLYLRIRHCASVQTAYAHLAGFAPDLKVGSTVQRGQVIASVGRTGWATGPHLYYEVIVNGRRVDPRRPGLQVPVNLPVAASLAPAAAPAATQQTAASGNS